MGKKSRSARHVKKMAEKRSAKNAKRAAYEANAQRGKTKRHGTTKVSAMLKGSHPQNPCGNPACQKCYPIEKAAKKGSTLSIIPAQAR